MELDSAAQYSASVCGCSAELAKGPQQQQALMEPSQPQKGVQQITKPDFYWVFY